MPYSPRGGCIYPGCTERSEPGSSYCARHKKQMDRDYNRYDRKVSTKKYGRAWKRIRDRYIQEHPLCEQCLADGKAVLAEEVHHKLPISRGVTHARSNLLSLCRSCHNKIHHDMGDR